MKTRAFLLTAGCLFCASAAAPSARAEDSAHASAGASAGAGASKLVADGVAGQDVALFTLKTGARTEIVTFRELGDQRREPGAVTLSFTAEGKALYVPWCGGRKSVSIDGREVATPKEGPFVTVLPQGRVDVSVRIVISNYERRVACSDAPRTGSLVAQKSGFFTLEFPSPSANKGGGRAVVYVPKNHDVQKPATVLVGVHPWNGGIWTYAQYMDLVREADALDVVLLHPSGLGNSLYVAEAESEVMRAMDVLARTIAVDPRRVSLWGASMGGGGATTIGFHRPDRFASITSFFGDAKFDLGTYVRNILPDEAAAHAVNPIDVIDNARHVPVWLVHGEADKTSPIRESELLDAALRKRGYTVRFDRVAGVGHEGRLVERFAAEMVKRASTAKAPEFPSRVTFRSVRAEDVSAYGVRIERTGSQDAFVDLEAKDGEVVVHEASGVKKIVLAKGALGIAEPKPVKSSRVPVSWE